MWWLAVPGQEETEGPDLTIDGIVPRDRVWLDWPFGGAKR
jgi:hypothetical protein